MTHTQWFIMHIIGQLHMDILFYFKTQYVLWNEFDDLSMQDVKIK
jgi:hypothetical protein